MKLILKSRGNRYSAIAEYNPTSKTVVVLTGSTISDSVSQGAFKSAKSISAKRASGCVQNNVLIEDVTFKSASSAANFVTGSSTNGLLAWKNEDGTPLKELI